MELLSNFNIVILLLSVIILLWMGKQTMDKLELMLDFKRITQYQNNLILEGNKQVLQSILNEREKTIRRLENIRKEIYYSRRRISNLEYVEEEVSDNLDIIFNSFSRELGTLSDEIHTLKHQQGIDRGVIEGTTTNIQGTIIFNN